jgi:hypothetical protein
MASNGVTDEFKKRNHFSLLRPHFKGHFPPSAQVDASFLADCKLFISQNFDCILNWDETSWKLSPNGILTWADRGSDNFPVNVTGNERLSHRHGHNCCLTNEVAALYSGKACNKTMGEDPIRGSPAGSDRSLQNRLDDRRDNAPIHRITA